MDFSKVIVALDTTDEQKALKLVRSLKQRCLHLRLVWSFLFHRPEYNK